MYFTAADRPIQQCQRSKLYFGQCLYSGKTTRLSTRVPVLAKGDDDVREVIRYGNSSAIVKNSSIL